MVRADVQSVHGFNPARFNLSTLERAVAIAATAHQGQIDKAGKPYLLHPLRVMLAVEGNDAQIVAVLHDVVEDSKGRNRWTLDDLRAEGFSETILEAIRSVTKREDGDESYMAFVMRAAANPIGRQVKLADLHDNCDLGRISAPEQRDHDRIAKYRTAIDLIESTRRTN